MTVREKLEKSIEAKNEKMYEAIMMDRDSLDFLSFAVNVWKNGGTIKKAGDPFHWFVGQPHGDAEPEDSEEWKRFLNPIMAQLDYNARKMFFTSITREQAQALFRVLSDSKIGLSVSLHAVGLEMHGSNIYNGWRTYHDGEYLFQEEAQSDSADVPESRKVSLDNGFTFLTAEEALDEMKSERCCVTWDALVNLMEDDTREAVHAELAPCTELEFLTRYLELANDDLVIG